MSIDHPWSNAPLRNIRRGNFWFPGQRVARSRRTYQHAPTYVEWKALEQVSRPSLIVTTAASDVAAAALAPMPARLASNTETSA